MSLLGLLLLPQHAPEGARKVTITVRPLRVAYLVDPSSVAIALAAVEAACLQWGGIHQFLIPCNPGGSPQPPSNAILELHDPDALIDLVGADASFVDHQQERWDRFTHRWERPTETMHLVGATEFTALRRWQRLRPAGDAHTVLQLTPLASHQLALPIAFNCGHLSVRTMPERSRLSEPYNIWREYIPNFFESRELDPSAIGEDDLRAILTNEPGSFSQLLDPFPRKSTSYHRLPDLTRVGLASSEPAHSYYGEQGPPPEVRQTDQSYFRYLIVVGRPESVENMCLAWNLRAQRSFSRSFPMWVSPDWLESPRVRAQIKRATDEEPAGLLERFETGPRLISATMNAQALEQIASNYGDLSLLVDESHLSAFFTSQFRVGKSTDLMATFTEGRTQLPLPDYWQFADFHFLEEIYWTIAVEDYQLPRVHWKHARALGLMYRVAGDGISGAWSVASGSPGALLNVGVLSGWDAIRGVASQGGYDLTVSDKGRRAMAVMNYLGDDRGMSVLASSRIYRLIIEMADIVPRQAVQQSLSRRMGTQPTPQLVSAVSEALLAHEIGPRQIERHHRSWSDLRAALGTNVPTSASERIVD